jgi:hypothetical protein
MTSPAISTIIRGAETTFVSCEATHPVPLVIASLSDDERGLSNPLHSPEGGFIVALSKSRRFEIFKRDAFTCQYCGQRPPEVILEVDHIEPRAAGGTDDELNLVTSCADCNRGKSARLLGDVRPKPDADLKYLEMQQEVAELRRYQVALAAREEVLKEVVIALQDLWMTIVDGAIDWHPADHIIRQFLARYAPEVVESAIRDVAPKVVSGYVSDRGGKWVPYMWSVMRNMVAE